MDIITTLIGVVLLVGGLLLAIHTIPKDTSDVPAALWTQDPTTTQVRDRRWDGQAWTWSVTGPPADGVASRGRWFKGRFWGLWALMFAAGLVVAVGAGVLYVADKSVPMFFVLGGLSQALLLGGFVWFVGRQLNWGPVIGPWPIVWGVVAGIGAALAIAQNLDALFIRLWGPDGALTIVGFVEEPTKWIVPLVLFAAGRARNPRAGLAMGLASATGFGMMEAAFYAIWNTSGTALKCGVDEATHHVHQPAGWAADQATILPEVARLIYGEAQHLFWVGIFVAVAWRLWRVYGGFRITWPVVGAALLPIALHSFGDSVAGGFFCHAGIGVSVAVNLGGFAVAYLLMKFFASQLTPPDIVTKVSRNWHPSHLRSDVTDEATAGTQSPGTAG